MKNIALLLLLIAIGNCAAVNNTCTAVGKFIADANCTSYIVCSQVDAQLTSYTIQCPPGFIVRYTDMVCSITGTQCEPSYACTRVGNFTNPTSVNASVYINCIQGIGDMIIATVMECPAPSEFNATLGGCEQKAVHDAAQSVAAATVQATAPVVAAVATSAAAVAINELAEAATGAPVIPPTIATVTQTTGNRSSNGSAIKVPSIHTILSTLLALLLFYKIK